MKNSAVLCQLPKTGLGNQLFSLMKACIFSEINELPIIFIGYNRLRLGPYLRRDKVKRNYRNYFVFQKNIFGESLDRFKLLFAKYSKTINEPKLKVIRDSSKNNTLYKFSSIPHWSNHFAELKEYRKEVIHYLSKIVQPNIQEKVRNFIPPEIGIHVRRGDFRKYSDSRDFDSNGTTQTPEEYFIEVINRLRSNNLDMTVKIFSDGFKDDMLQLCSLPNVQLLEGNPDIVDLLLLSKSKIIVTSATSTFSYWAGFLSDAPIIMHPSHIHQRIRNELNLFEGTIDEYLKDHLQNYRKINDFR